MNVSSKKKTKNSGPAKLSIQNIVEKNISGRQKQNHHQHSLFNRISKECTSKTPEAVSEMYNAIPRESKQGSC